MAEAFVGSNYELIEDALKSGKEGEVSFQDFSCVLELLSFLRRHRDHKIYLASTDDLDFEEPLEVAGILEEDKYEDETGVNKDIKSFLFIAPRPAPEETEEMRLRRKLYMLQMKFETYANFSLDQQLQSLEGKPELQKQAKLQHADLLRSIGTNYGGEVKTITKRGDKNAIK
jgi:hypothetical protein